MNRPVGTTKGNEAENPASPPASVVRTADPRNVSPSPLPDASHAWLEKNSNVKPCMDTLLSEPEIRVVPPEVTADLSTG
jgi:hypothetical protein